MTGSSRVSVGDSSRPVIKVASLDHELVLRRHAASLKSQHGNMDDTIVGNGKCFIMCMSECHISQNPTVLSQSTCGRWSCVGQLRRNSFICNDEKFINYLHTCSIPVHVQLWLPVAFFFYFRFTC